MQKPLASQLVILIVYLFPYFFSVIPLESKKKKTIVAVKLVGSQNISLRKLIIPLGN